MVSYLNVKIHKINQVLFSRLGEGCDWVWSEVCFVTTPIRKLHLYCSKVKNKTTGGKKKTRFILQLVSDGKQTQNAVFPRSALICRTLGHHPVLRMYIYEKLQLSIS